MYNDHSIVDDLISEIADSKSSYQEVAVETLKRLCFESCEAYDYLQGRVYDVTLSQYTQKQLSDILATVRRRFFTCHEYSQMYQILSRRDNDALAYVLRHNSVPKIY